VGVNGNGLNRSRKPITEFFKHPAPQSVTYTYRLSQLSTPNSSSRTLPLKNFSFQYYLRRGHAVCEFFRIPRHQKFSAQQGIRSVLFPILFIFSALIPGCRIQIRSRSVFAELQDPDPNFEYKSRSTRTQKTVILKKCHQKPLIRSF